MRLISVNSFPQDSESESSGDLTKALGKLTVDDDSSAIFSDGTSSGSESSHGRSSTIQVLRCEKLNQFLHICCKEECGSGQPQKSWENMYVPRAATAIAAALEVITPGDAGHLWEAVQ